jgi:hydrogenase large subunit
MDPVPRIEGHLGIEIGTNATFGATGVAGTVTDVNAKAEMYRGYENILKGRHPGDALQITQRI